MTTIENISFQKCTQTEYDELITKDSNTFYITTDTQRLYLGDVLYNNMQDESEGVSGQQPNMDSFYGENPDGFFIVKTFTTYAALAQAFNNPNYNDVKYGQYAMVSVLPDNDDPPGSAQEYAQNNGKVYKRGFDGPEYICRITGPAGPPSKLNIVTIADARTGSQENDLTASLTNGGLVPGKEDENTYNDSIKWNFYHEDVGGEDQVNLGFEIPYPTFDFEAESASIDEPRILMDYKENDIIDGEKAHPFHTNLKLQLPLKRNGSSIDNLRVVIAEENDGVDYSAIEEAEANLLKQNNTPILVYEKTEYDVYNNPTTTLKFASEFTLFSNIDVSNQGYLQFWIPGVEGYPDPSPIVTSIPIIPTITNVELSETGFISLTFQDFRGNTTTMQINENPISWIKDINYTSKGGLTITWNTEEEQGQADTTTIEPTETFITDIAVFGNSLYKTYIGIEEEICAEANLTLAQLAETSAEAINSTLTSFGKYYKLIKNNEAVWYKKIFDFNTSTSSSQQGAGE